MSCEIKMHIIPDNLTVEDIRVFKSNECGSRWFGYCRGDQDDYNANIMITSFGNIKEHQYLIDHPDEMSPEQKRFYNMFQRDRDPTYDDTFTKIDTSDLSTYDLWEYTWNNPAWVEQILDICDDIPEITFSLIRDLYEICPNDEPMNAFLCNNMGKRLFTVAW